jgi:hypothetical protein
VGRQLRNATWLWRFYADPDKLTASIDDQGRMLSPASDQLSEAKLLFASYAEGSKGKRASMQNFPNACLAPEYQA